MPVHADGPTLAVVMVLIGGGIAGTGAEAGTWFGPDPRVKRMNGAEEK
jgi:hypothetical protein